jgi:hypothetical protein
MPDQIEGELTLPAPCLLHIGGLKGFRNAAVPIRYIRGGSALTPQWRQPGCSPLEQHQLAGQYCGCEPVIADGILPSS